MRQQDDSRPKVNLEKPRGVHLNAGRKGALPLGRVPAAVYLGIVVLLAVLLNLKTLHNTG